jgi:hypothetical protein
LKTPDTTPRAAESIARGCERKIALTGEAIERRLNWNTFAVAHGLPPLVEPPSRSPGEVR